MNDETVLLIDDDEAVRHSVIKLLRDAGLTARAYASGTEFLSRVPDLAIACVVTDMRMPDVDGAGVVSALRAMGRDNWPVIVITGHADVPLAVQMMKAGVVDFIEKPFDPTRLIESVRGSLAALRSVQDSQTARQAAQQRFELLTPREREVFAELITGSTNKEVAIKLQVSPRTVEVFRASVMKKMNADSLAALVRLALTFDRPVRTRATSNAD